MRRMMTGNQAVVEAAVRAGCRFFSGYPITPVSDLMEYMARRLAQVGGVFIQMEDELGAITAAIGASWAGKKSMTATSGPGFSLMQEGIGYAAMTETPVVVVDSQRGGPSTGQPTMPSQGDVLQARYGSHGDYPIAVLAPSDIQEVYDLTIKAFNIAEALRTPVVLLMDAFMSHMAEPVSEGECEILERKVHPPGPVERPYEPGEDLVPPFPVFGRGNLVSVTGLTHDEKGVPRPEDNRVHASLIRRLFGKFERRKDLLEDVRTMGDGRRLVIAYGMMGRLAEALVDRGYRLLRPRVLWPAPTGPLKREMAEADVVYVVEMNIGKYSLVVKRVAEELGIEVRSISILGGRIPTPSELEAMME